MTGFPGFLDEYELAWLLETDDIDEMREAHDRLSGWVAKVDWRIRELEGREARTEERELIRDYQASVL